MMKNLIKVYRCYFDNSINSYVKAKTPIYINLNHITSIEYVPTHNLKQDFTGDLFYIETLVNFQSERLQVTGDQIVEILEKD